MLQLIYTLCQMTSGWGQGASLETVTFDFTISAFGFHRHGCRLSVDVKL